MILDDVRANIAVELLPAFDNSLKNATIVRAHNVADYYYQQERDYWDLDDFPNVAPPWPNIWVEWNLPPSWITNDISPEKIGHAKVEEVKKGLWRVYSPLGGPDYAACHLQYEELDWLKEIGAKWMLTSTYYRSWAPGQFMWAQRFFIAEDGKIRVVKSREEDTVKIVLKNLGLTYEDNRQGKELIVPTTVSSDIYDLYKRNPTVRVVDISCHDVAFLTTSFCHCKNVSAIKNTIAEPLKKKRANTGKLPINKTYTLNIQPLKGILKHQGSSESVGLKKAMHICRGHFADYRDGPGLFGKYHGEYFIPMHVRGLQQQGQVKKAYNVKL